MQMRVEIDPVAEGLDDGDNPGLERPPRHGPQINENRPDRTAAEIPQKPALELEEDPQHLGDREDHLAVRDAQEERLPHPHAPLLQPLGMARGTKAPRLAGKRQKMLRPAARTPNPGSVSQSFTRRPSQGEATPRIAAVEVFLDDLFDDGTEKAALIRFAPEDCKARRPSRSAPHIPPQTSRNDGPAPDREPCVPDDEDGRFPPWREKNLKKRADIGKPAASPWNQAFQAARKAGIRPEIVNRR